jgi:hypothetical protein
VGAAQNEESMIDKHEDALMSQLANMKLAVRAKEKELDDYRRSKCPVKVGDVVETKQGERRKVYAVNLRGSHTVMLRCYRQKKDGTFGRAFCVEFLDGVKVVD